jgi:hypothetical protein
MRSDASKAFIYTISLLDVALQPSDMVSFRMPLPETSRKLSSGANGLLPDHLRQRIGALALEKKPLNIAAVKRHTPDLLAEVYAQSPFLGWKRALELAGIDPQTIAVELLDACGCLICGVRAAILTGHLHSVHRLTTAAYQEQYPAAAVTAETVRAKKMRPAKHFPHWEPHWTPEYVLDRIEEYRVRGFPLNYGWIASHERALASAALLNHGSWDQALRRMGIDPGEARMAAPAQSLSRSDVIEQLQQRKRQKLPLSTALLAKENLRLMNASIRRFGSYENALRAAGIKPSDVLQRPAYYTVTDKRLLLQEARRIGKLKGRERYKAARILHREFEGLATSCFGSWHSVAESAEVPVERLVEHRFPSREAVMEWLADWTREGNPLKGGTLFRKDRGLYNAVCRHFGSFAALIEQLQGAAIFRMPAKAFTDREPKTFGTI